MTTAAHLKARAHTLRDVELADTLKWLKHDKEANPAWIDALEAEADARKNEPAPDEPDEVEADAEPTPHKTTARKKAAPRKTTARKAK